MASPRRVFECHITNRCGRMRAWARRTRFKIGSEAFRWMRAKVFNYNKTSVGNPGNKQGVLVTSLTNSKIEARMDRPKSVVGMIRAVASTVRRSMTAGQFWHLRYPLPQGNRLLLDVSVRYRLGKCGLVPEGLGKNHQRAKLPYDHCLVTQQIIVVNNTEATRGGNEVPVT